MKYEKQLNITAMVLTFIGSINWGIMGISMIFGMAATNMIEKLFGASFFTGIIYTLVGISAIWLLVSKKK